MIYYLTLFTVLQAWFVGPLPLHPLSTDGAPVYFIGPSRGLGSDASPENFDRVVLLIDPPAPTEKSRKQP